VPAWSTAGEELYQSIRQVLEQVRASAYLAVNFAMVQAYWQVPALRESVVEQAIS
jgi:hypothetical protein